MNYVLTADEIRAAERAVINGGVDEIFLRMNAALAVADGIFDRARSDGAVTAFFCGAGGNGFDGILAASMLSRRNCKVEVYTVGDVSKFSAAALSYAKNEGLELRSSKEYKGGATNIVDAIFGIGLNRDVTGDAAGIIEKLNAEHGFKLAVDIPSGLNADSGKVMGVAFKADITMSFSCYKRGMLFENGRDCCGMILVEQVGIKTSSDTVVFDDGDFKPYRRAKSAHKGSVGRVFVIGGSGNMIGAPMLAGAAAHAAYLNGAGTVTVCLPEIHRVAASARATMAMTMFLRDTPEGFISFDKNALDDIISKATAIDIGPGMGSAPELKKIVMYIAENFGGTFVVDADALNAIKDDYAFLKTAKAKVVITPHVGEFKRLTGMDATIENAVSLARELGIIVVLKSATTIITDGKTVRLNLAGTPAMAKGGSGDVLGGCITALSCAFGAFDAASIACYRNGMGAERAVKSYAEMMLTARDVLKFADYKELL